MRFWQGFATFGVLEVVIPWNAVFVLCVFVEQPEQKIYNIIYIIIYVYIYIAQNWEASKQASDSQAAFAVDQKRLSPGRALVAHQ